MAQNVFIDPSVEAKKKRPQGQIPNGQNPPPAGGFGQGVGASEMPRNEAEMGQADAFSAPLLSSYSPQGTSAYRGGSTSRHIESPIDGFGGGYGSELPNLPMEAQQRWQSRGIDFDGLLKAGVAKSMQDESIGQDMWQRHKAAELNNMYIQGAAEQMRPGQIDKSTDVNLLQQLIQQRTLTMDKNQQLQIDANIAQVLQRLGLNTQPQTPAQPAQNAGGSGEAMNTPNPNLDGFGGKVQAFVGAAAPAAGAVGLPMMVSRALGASPNPWLKGAGMLGATLAGSYGGNKVADFVMPQNDQAQAQNPGTAAAGTFAGTIGGFGSSIKRGFQQLRGMRTPGAPPANFNPPGPQMAAPQPQVPIKPSQNFTPPPPAPTPTPAPQAVPTGFGGFGNFAGPNPNIPATPPPSAPMNIQGQAVSTQNGWPKGTQSWAQQGKSKPAAKSAPAKKPAAKPQQKKP